MAAPTAADVTAIVGSSMRVLDLSKDRVISLVPVALGEITYATEVYTFVWRRPLFLKSQHAQHRSFSDGLLLNADAERDLLTEYFRIICIQRYLGSFQLCASMLAGAAGNASHSAPCEQRI